MPTDETTIAYYLTCCRSMTSNGIIIFVHSRLSTLEERGRYDDARKGVGLPKLIDLSARVLAAVHVDRGVGTSKLGKLAISNPDGIAGAIPMPPVLESSKAMVKSNADKDAAAIGKPIRVPRNPPALPIAARESPARSYSPDPVPLSDLIAGELLGVAPGEDIELAVLKRPLELRARGQAPRRSGVKPYQWSDLGNQTTILPPPASNTVETPMPPSAPLPREEAAQGRQTNAPRSVATKGVHYTPPAPGSDHSAIRNSAHDPESGKYSFIALAEDEREGRKSR